MHRLQAPWIVDPALFVRVFANALPGPDDVASPLSDDVLMVCLPVNPFNHTLTLRSPLTWFLHPYPAIHTIIASTFSPSCPHIHAALTCHAF